MGKSSNLPKNFDQEAKDRIVRLVEDRILAENISMLAACNIVAPKAGHPVAHSEAMDASPLVGREALLNGCLRALLQKTHGCFERITSCGTPMSC